MRTAEDYIKMYKLLPHPEGGYYAPQYRSKQHIDVDGESRALYSSIYFLFERDSFSALHRLRADEFWHWHDGDTIVLVEIDKSGSLATTRLGREKGIFQHLIPAGVWFGGYCEGEYGYALMGCTVHPGFEFEDFELGTRKELKNVYPQHAEIIEKLTRE